MSDLVAIVYPSEAKAEEIVSSLIRKSSRGLPGPRGARGSADSSSAMAGE